MTTLIRENAAGDMGARRMGKPRTNAQRRARHRRLFGTSKLPPRGTGLKRRGM